VACAVQVMAAHIREGLEGTGETARKCREYVINRVLGAPGEPVPSLPVSRVTDAEIGLMLDTPGNPLSAAMARPTELAGRGMPAAEAEEPLAAPGSFEDALLGDNPWVRDLTSRSAQLRALEELKAENMAKDAEREWKRKKAAEARAAARGAQAGGGGRKDRGEGPRPGTDSPRDGEAGREGGVAGKADRPDGPDKGKDDGKDDKPPARERRVHRVQLSTGSCPARDRFKR